MIGNMTRREQLMVASGGAIAVVLLAIFAVILRNNFV